MNLDVSVGKPWCLFRMSKAVGAYDLFGVASPASARPEEAVVPFDRVVQVSRSPIVVRLLPRTDE